MNQKTLITLAVVVGVGALAYYLYTKSKTPATTPPPQTNTSGNSLPGTITAASDAFGNVVNALGL